MFNHPNTQAKLRKMFDEGPDEELVEVCIFEDRITGLFVERKDKTDDGK
jgi:hypothetical protein